MHDRGVEHWQQQIDMAREQTELLFGGVAQGAFVAEDHRQATGPQHFAYAAQRQAEGLRVEWAVRSQLPVGG